MLNKVISLAGCNACMAHDCLHGMYEIMHAIHRCTCSGSAGVLLRIARCPWASFSMHAHAQLAEQCHVLLCQSQAVHDMPHLYTYAYVHACTAAHCT